MLQAAGENMCYAVPGKIIGIDGENATVDYGGVTKTANISLMESVAKGDFVLVHAGFAIEKIDAKSAKESLDLIRSYIEASGDGR